MVSNFSCAFWTSVCLLWRNVYLDLHLLTFQVESPFRGSLYLHCGNLTFLKPVLFGEKMLWFSTLSPSAPDGRPLMDSSESQ